MQWFIFPLAFFLGRQASSVLGKPLCKLNSISFISRKAKFFLINKGRISSNSIHVKRQLIKWNPVWYQGFVCLTFCFLTKLWTWICLSFLHQCFHLDPQNDSAERVKTGSQIYWKSILDGWMDWLTDWLIDWSIDWSIVWSMD